MKDWRITLSLIGVVFLWGSSFLLSKLALTELGPMCLAFYRWVIGSVGLIGCLTWHGRLGEVYENAHQRFWTFALLGLVGVTLFFVFQNLGLQYTIAVKVGVLINLNPVFIALLSMLTLGEGLNKLQWGGILLAGVGVVFVITTGQDLAFRGHSLLGDGLTVLSALCWAVYSILGRRLLGKLDPLLTTGIATVWGTLWLLPLAAGEGLALKLSPQIWLTIGVLGLLCSALAYLLWFRILNVVPPGRAAIYLYLIPLVSSALAVVFLHEPFTHRTGLGTGLILMGILCTEIKSEKYNA